MLKTVDTYKELVASSPLVEKITTPEVADMLFGCNETTIKSLEGVWFENAKKNIGLYRKHGSIYDHLRGFGINKAVIVVGAGPSFHKNKEVLRGIYRMNLMLPLHEQPFIIVASNKMFKPLLEYGIHPHFVMLVDAGDSLYPQLCEGIPDKARGTILISGLNTSNKILKKWDRQGNNICFFGIGDEKEKTWFREQTGEDPENVHISQGGNLINTLWIICNRFFGSTSFMMVGNDLSFKYTQDKAERERSFYADGDYRLNILNRRDEAKDKFGWMGFDLKECSIAPGRYLYDLNPVGVSRQMWVYKTWLEVQAAVWSERVRFMIFNCSEAGSLGVLARNYSKQDMYDKNNWFLIDEILPKRWLTTSLFNAANMFLEARKCLRKESPLVIPTGTLIAA